MKSDICKKREGSYFRIWKYGTVLLFMLVSVFLVACGSGTLTPGNDPKQPQVVATVDLNADLTPVPTAAPINCGVWTTSTTPVFNPGANVPIYAKFTRLVDHNPQGIGSATANIIVTWADGYSTSVTTQTSGDGLAVAWVSIPGRSNLINKNNTITVTFSAPDGTTCIVDGLRAGFFTLIPAAASPTRTPKPD